MSKESFVKEMVELRDLDILDADISITQGEPPVYGDRLPIFMKKWKASFPRCWWDEVFAHPIDRSHPATIEASNILTSELLSIGYRCAITEDRETIKAANKAYPRMVGLLNN